MDIELYQHQHIDNQNTAAVRGSSANPEAEELSVVHSYGEVLESVEDYQIDDECMQD